jgi:hypothetical protein
MKEIVVLRTSSRESIRKDRRSGGKIEDIRSNNEAKARNNNKIIGVQVLAHVDDMKRSTNHEKVLLEVRIPDVRNTRKERHQKQIATRREQHAESNTNVRYNIRNPGTVF